MLRSMWYNDHRSDTRSMDADIYNDNDSLILFHNEILFEDHSRCQTSRRRK